MPNRREFVRRSLAATAALALPPMLGCEEQAPEAGGVVARTDPQPAQAPPTPEDAERLVGWIRTLHQEGAASADRDVGLTAARVGELAIGTPYEAFTLEEYIRSGGSPMRTEPLTLHLDRFDCVSLVESCLATARVARSPDHAATEPVAELWAAFAREMERMRYRDGERAGYTSRLHYFSEWLADNERRGLVRDIGRELGATADERPLRFMSQNPDAYPAMQYPEIREEIAEIERRLDDTPRWVVPTSRIPEVSDRIQTGDILAFATSIEGLDVTHAAFAYRDDDAVLRVLHAPLSGGVVEITRTTVPEYVAAIRRSTGILVARPLQG